MLHLPFLYPSLFVDLEAFLAEAQDLKHDRMSPVFC